MRKEMKFHTLQDLFVDTLKDLYDAEQQIEKALPIMAKVASSPELKQGFEQHLEQTRNQEERLAQIFRDLNLHTQSKKCKGMEGILSEGQEMMGEKADPDVMDAGLIETAQKVEHYEIATYGTARTFANRLGYTNAARLLQQTLEEEKQTDEKLTVLAEHGINDSAMTSK
jgi:ferritin-like metal-binding protein YciE